MKHFFFIIYILCFISSDAQSSFTINYGDNLYSSGNAVIPLQNGGFLLGARYTTTGNYIGCILRVGNDGRIIWTKRYPGFNVFYGIDDVKQLANGDLLLAGDYRSSGDDTSLQLLKTDSSGSVLWSRKYLFTGGGAHVRIEATHDHGILVCGRSALDYAFAIGKLDSLGNIIWSKRIDGVICTAAMHEDNDGNIVVAWSEMNVFVLKMDKNGNTIWNKKLAFNNYYDFDMVITDDNGMVITGGCDLNNQLASETFAVKLDKNGNSEWFVTYDWAEGGENGISITKTIEGSFVIASNTQDLFGDSSPALIKIDTEGHLIWAKKYGSELYDLVNRVRITLDSGIVFTGRSCNEGIFDSCRIFLTRTDIHGHVECFEDELDLISSGENISNDTAVLSIYDIGYSYTNNVIDSTVAIHQKIICEGTDSIPQVISYSYVLTVMPNPLTTEINFSLTSDSVKTIHLKLFNILGQTLFEGTTMVVAGINNGQIPIKFISPGIYFLAAQIDDLMLIEKILKE